MRRDLIKRIEAIVLGAEEHAGTLPAKEAVKLRPADWHAVCRVAREAAAALEAEASEGGCMCRGVEIGSHMASVSLPIPEHMNDYRKARVAEGLSPMISVDACLVVELRLLWARGIRTYGSCCGHNKTRGMINVHEDDGPAMIAMGYDQWPEEDGRWHATFFPKSVRALIPEAPARKGE